MVAYSKKPLPCSCFHILWRRPHSLPYPPAFRKKGNRGIKADGQRYPLLFKLLNISPLEFANKPFLDTIRCPEVHDKHVLNRPFVGEYCRQLNTVCHRTGVATSLSRFRSARTTQDTWQNYKQHPALNKSPTDIRTIGTDRVVLSRFATEALLTTSDCHSAGLRTH